MNKISCDMCIDLMPLVQDGVASEDSRNAVLQHLQECPDCRALYEGEIPTPSNTKEILGKVKRRAQLFSAMVMMFGIFYGLMLHWAIRPPVGRPMILRLHRRRSPCWLR